MNPALGIKVVIVIGYVLASTVVVVYLAEAGAPSPRHIVAAAFG